MKAIIIGIALASAFTATAAFSAPKPVNATSIEVLNVIIDNQAEFNKLSKEGTTITNAEVEKLNSKQTQYTITNRFCRLPFGGCVGGATLTIVRTLVQASNPHFTYTSRIDRLR
jgi:hypothetical protein